MAHRARLMKSDCFRLTFGHIIDESPSSWGMNWELKRAVKMSPPFSHIIKNLVHDSGLQKAARSLRMHFGLFGVKGVLSRGLLSLSIAHNPFEASIPKSSERVFLRLGTTDVAAFEQVFVHDEYGFSLASPPSIIVDAGANIGMSSVYFARRYPDAKIIAIEPEPANFSILRKNAQMYPRIVPLQAALWSRDGSVEVYDSGRGSWGMRVKDGDGHPVRSLKLDTLLHEYNIDKIDLLKIDIEGAEWEVFKDAQSWIGRVDAICIELHDRFHPGCTDAFEAATVDFPLRWQRGELSCVVRCQNN